MQRLLIATPGAGCTDRHRQWSGRATGLAVEPRDLADFAVYYRTGGLVLAGSDIFNTTGLPWVYHRLLALLTVPLALLSCQW